MSILNYQPFHRKLSATLIPLIFIFSSISLATLSADGSKTTTPNINLTPEEVVQIVVYALANNDAPYPDAGIEITFNFASPANKSNTGPLIRFARMVKSPVFAVMLNHKKSEFSEVVLGDTIAFQVVKITTQANTEVHFAFRLGLQTEGEFEGMWMTEAVWPLDKKIEGIKV